MAMAEPGAFVSPVDTVAEVTPSATKAKPDAAVAAPVKAAAPQGLTLGHKVAPQVALVSEIPTSPSGLDRRDSLGVPVAVAQVRKLLGGPYSPLPVLEPAPRRLGRPVDALVAAAVGTDAK